MKKCKKCGERLNKKEKFCSACGTKVTKSKKKVIGTILMLLFIIFMGGMILHKWKVHQDISQKTVEGFLNAYKETDGETCGKLLYNNPSEKPIEFSNTQKLLGQGIEYKIKKVRDKKGYWEVETEIKNIDFVKTVLHFENADNVSIEDIDFEIKKENREEKNYKCKIVVRKVGEEYKIVMTPEFSNALLGGINEYINTVMSEGE